MTEETEDNLFVPITAEWPSSAIDGNDGNILFKITVRMFGRPKC